MKTNHILVPTDLSEATRRPGQVAAELAAQWDARITLLHVVQDLRVAPHGAPLAPAQSAPGLHRDVELATPKLEAVREELGGDVEVKAEIITSDGVADAIVRFADENSCGLIVLSTHGRTGLRHLVLGSVAEAVLRKSHIPVLCLPPAKKSG